MSGIAAIARAVAIGIIRAVVVTGIVGAVKALAGFSTEPAESAENGEREVVQENQTPEPVLVDATARRRRRGGGRRRR